MRRPPDALPAPGQLRAGGLGLLQHRHPLLGGVLVDITHLLAEQRNLTLDAAVSEKLLAIYQRAVCVENFGNGRLARNLLEHACMRQAGRLIRTGPEQVTRRELGLLLPEDFEAPTLSCRQERQRTIGFV